MKLNSLSSFKWCSLLTFIALAGCGGGADRPALIPVSGTVMYNGKPIAGASVAFYGPKAPRAATGTTDENGKFSLSMFDANDGTVAGDNIITVSKVEGGAPAAASNTILAPPDPLALAKSGQDESKKKADGGPKYIVPKKYGDQTTTPLKEKIVEGNQPVLIQLVD